MLLRKLIAVTAGLFLALPALGDGAGKDMETQQSKVEKTEMKKAEKKSETEQAQSVIQIDSVNKVLDNPGAYVGKRISMDGEVEEVHGMQSFQLDGPGWWNDEIMVITRQPLSQMTTAALVDGSEVSITGEVVAMTTVEVEREYGWDFDPEIEIELEGTQTFVIADSIEVTEAN